MLEHGEEFLTSIRMIWSSRTLSRTRAKSWKCHSNPPCLARVLISKRQACAHTTILENQDAHVSFGAHESTRTRTGTTEPRDHDDRSTEKGFNSLSHYNLVHTPISSHPAMKIPDAKAAVDKEWEKLEKWPALQVTIFNSKKGVIEKAQKEERTVHFATLMDLCHLKNSKLEQKFPRYKGRVVLRGDDAKDDSGSYAVCLQSSVRQHH